MRIRVIDFETTGEPPEADVVEAAYVDVVGHPRAAPLPQHAWTWGTKVPGWSTLIRPTRPIDVEARAAHHLSEADVLEGEDWGMASDALVMGCEGNAPPDLYCAHNAAFERQLFDPPGARWICTYKAALRLWPDAPRHSNQVLRYWLEGCDPGGPGMPPHRALPDCRVTALILVRCLREATIEQLEAWTAEPAYKPIIGFGKHRGKRWTEVPRDYIAWVLKQDFDEDTKWNARQALGGQGA